MRARRSNLELIFRFSRWAAQIFLGDDKNRRGGFEKIFFTLGDRRHLDIHQLFESQPRQVGR